MSDEQFERDLRAALERAMRRPAPPALRARVAETLATPRPHRSPWLAHGLALAAGLAAAVVLVAAAVLVYLLRPATAPQIGARPTPAATIRGVGPGLPTSDAWAPDGASFALDEQASGSGQAVVHVFARSGAPLRQIDGWDLVWTGARTFLVSRAPSGGSVVSGSLDSGALSSVADATFAGLVASGHLAAALGLPWTDSTQARFVVWQAGAVGPPQPGIPLAWSPDGSRLAVVHVTQHGQSTGGEDAGWLEVLRVPSLASVAAIHAPPIGVRGAPIFDASGTHLAWPWADASGAGVAILDLASGHVVTLNLGGVESLAWDGTRLLAAEWQRGQIGAFDSAGAALPSDLPFADRVSVSPAGILATYELGQGSAIVRDGGTVQTLPVCGKQVSGISWAPDGRAFLASCIQADGTPATVLVELSGPTAPGPAPTPTPQRSPSAPSATPRASGVPRVVCDRSTPTSAGTDAAGSPIPVKLTCANAVAAAERVIAPDLAVAWIEFDYLHWCPPGDFCAWSGLNDGHVIFHVAGAGPDEVVQVTADAAGRVTASKPQPLPSPSP